MMRVSPRGPALAGLVLSLVALAGCGMGEEKLYHVSGTVTYNGKPVAKGLISFDPDGTKGTAGAQGFANILNGKYDTAETGKGVRGGAYVVRVNGFDGKEANDAPFGQALFTEYTCSKDLPKEDSTYDLNVPKGR